VKIKEISFESKKRRNTIKSTRAEEHLTIDLFVEQVAATRVQEHLIIDLLVELF
jgi:hypothetical protein